MELRTDLSPIILSSNFETTDLTPPPSAGQKESMLNRVKYSVVSASMGWLGENLDGTKN